MNLQKICRHIDEGANFYLRTLGNAEHMEYLDNGLYSIVRPRAGQEGCTALFDIRLEHLSDEAMKVKIQEIKKLNLHTWWGIGISEKMLRAVYGENLPLPATFTNEEEGCMAMLCDEIPPAKEENSPFTVRKVTTPDEFEIWAEICNRILHNNYPMLHPVNHYALCKEGVMSCFIAHDNDVPASVCSIIYNKEGASLEFVCTLKEYRLKGLAKAVCIAAIQEAFSKNSEIITLRALPDVKGMYRKLGFQLYNHPVFYQPGQTI
ncbi:GNAT family N-acetyltransferase [Anaerocolumna sp. AGMB13020]|uniref:GNAT family N-acetyltransferase n=1 Tax=Anaerocolumna sp. AGMB13020 TaxID=3081750 RepID=UPI002954BE87|nr:GNAT family N-acetyltransferase [Anaerocolumna sp. AGMB13020]WOO38429.1 GNAT family N-acetyltransferase [Anaerocolumna sp. AGMB13020]